MLQSRKLNHGLNKHNTTCTIDSVPAISFFIFLFFYSFFRFFMEVGSLLERCISEFKPLFFHTVR